MEKFWRGVQATLMPLARIGLAAIVFIHGWNRLLGPGGIQRSIDTLAAAGLPVPTLFAWGTVVLELAGGVLLAFGVLTRLVAAAFVAEFVTILLWLRWWHGFFVVDGGYEYTVVLALLALTFVGYGGGLLSVDRLFRRNKVENEEQVITG